MGKQQPNWDGKTPVYWATTDRAFISAKLDDNPYLDRATYEKSLAQLDSRTRKQLRGGDWTDFSGNHYQPDTWPRYTDAGDAYRVGDGPGRWKHVRKAECSRLLTLDWAMGKPKKNAAGASVVAPDGGVELTGDCTAFVVADLADDPELNGMLFILWALNERIPLASNAPRLEEACKRWHPLVVAGDDDNLSETMLLETRRYRDIPSITCMGIRGKNKLTRSQAAIVRAERGMFYLPEHAAHATLYGQRFDGQEVSGNWVETLCDQLSSFTGADGESDDLADAVSIMGRLADQFRPGEQDDGSEPGTIGGGYPGAGGW